MRLIETTVACDHPGCTQTVTVTGHSHADITTALTAAGWPPLRGPHDYCPNHRHSKDRS